MSDRLGATALFAAAWLAGCSAPEPADLILTGGPVHTMDGTGTVATAVALRDGRILAVGGTEVLDRVGPDTRIVDLAGRPVLPGLHDAHGHLASLGAALEAVDLVGTRSWDEVVDRVAEAASERPDRPWIRGHGWDQNDWTGVHGFPEHHLLSERVARPVVLSRIDGHALVANAAAMAAAGVTSATPDPDGGRIVRDAAGGPTGVFIDSAMGLIRAAQPALDDSALRRRLVAAQSACLAVGLTAVHDAGVGADEVEVLRSLEAEGIWKLRVHGMHAGLPERGVEPFSGDRVSFRSVKLVADGALGSRGAWLLEPYADEAATSGLPQLSPAQLVAAVSACLERGFQMRVHAIGDAAVRAVLDACQGAGVGERDARFTVEHAQIIHPDDLGRFTELGVTPSMQPTHLTSDGPWFGDRIGDRPAHAYAWRDLLETGVRLPLGSDFPVESHDPLLGLGAAVTRARPGQGPATEAGPWDPGQALSVDEAVRGMTVDAAWVAFREDRSGRVMPGFEADLTVLSMDPFNTPPGSWGGLRAEMTIVAGEIVFER